MPAGISQSVVTPAALTLRSVPEAVRSDGRSRDTAAAAQIENPQTALAAGSGELVRSPEPETGAQGAENRPALPPEDSAAETAGAFHKPATVPSGLQAMTEKGIGVHLDLIG